jgi:hypothetical protein
MQQIFAGQSRNQNRTNSFNGTAYNAETSRTAMSIGSGPGAPIFEPGPQTRIRRAPVQAIAAVKIDNGPREIFGRVVNISPGGCLLQTEATLESGTFVDLKVTVLGQEEPIRVEVSGVIRRQVEDSSRRQYGVEFLAVDSSDKQSLQWLYGQATG